ncbi:hypothetical protein ACFQHV_23835 [Promicromonospora thailandica]|uniref:Uncharacterized protein n=1 Tax=Promicromonospora thailandica TaxID=765201 RepID=A0A9X2G9E3_9MICO|nr:hypothetical protein [Promicromonospora thailandica]MCP2264381.1 hypothetical protein [Promicromonospora thailandica]BFF20925.1 hypothetical protein GCM10025730_44460 [Promicromonospora thailandica]
MLPTPPDVDLDSLFRVPQGKMLHARECQHLTEKSLAVLEPATELDLAKYPICSSCRDALSTGGRTHYTSFDTALEALPVPLEHRPRMREIAAALDTARIWIPASRSYIAVSAGQGIEAAAYFNKTFVDLHQEGGGYDREWMPGHRTARQASEATLERLPPVCPTCSFQLPASGHCDNCD